jgi:hypothetical protein
MSATPTMAIEQQATTYTDRLSAALRLFNGCRGTVTIAGRSLHGFGEQGALIAPPFDQGVPLPVLQLLVDGYSLRLSPATRSGQALAEMPFLWVLWRPATRFDKITGYRHAVEPAAQAAIADALATMPLPSVLVDAGPEVWAGWRLAEPFDLLHQTTEARGAQVALAERLGGDVKTAEDLSATLPLAGVIRNWNNIQREYIEITIAEPARMYRVEQLLEPQGGDEQ